MRSGVVKVAENRQLALNLSNDRGHFVAQPQIDGEVRAPAPIVLSIGSQNGLTNAARADGTRDGRAQRDGVVGEEAGERIEKELTVWTAHPKFVIANALDAHAEFRSEERRVGKECRSR